MSTLSTIVAYGGERVKQTPVKTIIYFISIMIYSIMICASFTATWFSRLHISKMRLCVHDASSCLGLSMSDSFGITF